jgi:CRP-like cAMP-binding protein
MTATSKVEQLRTTSFFGGFDEGHLTELAKLCREVDFPAGHTVFEEYEPAKSVYVILSGEISLAICDAKKACRQIASVRDGDLLGWSPLVGRSRLYDTARTMTPVKALEFDGSQLMMYCESNPSFGFKFMHRAACTLAQRLSGARQQLWLSGGHLPEYQVESD